jgi:hypothetical protein
MKVYSNTLTDQDLRDAAKAARVGLWVCDRITRTRISKNAWEVSLTGSSPYTSQMGDYHKAATYDEHGYWMAELFAKDPDARISWWKNADHFNEGTEHKYTAVLA